MNKFQIVKLQDAKDLPLPKYMTKGSAGMDVYACVFEPTYIKKGEIKLIRTGIKLAVPMGYEVQVRARSGLSLKHGITLINGVGTVDSDYRGEICVPLVNLGNEDFLINRGERIAQMVIKKIEQINFEEVEEVEKFEEVEDFDTTERGEGGFGSTGNK